MKGFAEKDVQKIDGDIGEALNDKVGEAKKITFKLGPKTSKYAFNSRLNVIVDNKNGITLEWNSDW